MQPRLKTSTRWTPLPPDVIDQIKALIKENFQNELKNSEVFVEGQIYPQEICLRVGFLEKGRLSQQNFEVSMDYKMNEAGDSALQCLSHCVDVAGSLMAEHFENTDNPPELPYTWTESDFEGKKVWVQFSTENSDLEKQASKILGEENDHLLRGNLEDEEGLVSEDGDEDADEDNGEGDEDPEDSGSKRTLH
ncbi:MAG: hypothetical protein ACK5W9_14345 [Bdellovibrionales bacterium]